jgi:exodeoxyribonuclease VII small subunit
MTEARSQTEPSFESALERLEEIVSKLEGGEMPLEEALEVFEEGVRLSRFCHGKLSQAERRVEILLKNDDGAIEAHLFQEDVPQKSE